MKYDDSRYSLYTSSDWLDMFLFVLVEQPISRRRITCIKAFDALPCHNCIVVYLYGS
jgi:hypothetical protein